ncbi:MAG: efflux RND transporter periplasmic adaptor subunit [Paracoccaceae bacterium]
MDWQALARAGLALAVATTGTLALAQGAAPVETATLEARAVVERVRLVGTVVAPRTARVSTEIASRVAAMEVALGRRVEAGDALVTLDATLERLDLERTEAMAAADEARLDDARRQFRDAERLAAGNNLPENEVDTRRAAVAIAEAELAQDRAEIRRLSERVERHVVRAPFDGVVTERMTEAGEWVEPGTAVVEVVAADALVVDLPVPQRYYPRVAPGTAVRLGFEAIAGRTLDAEVVVRVPRSDPAARTFTLRVRPLAEGLPIAPGMSASATLSLDTGREAVVVPRDALTRRPDGRTTVWVVAGEGSPTVEERVVETAGAAGDGTVYVRRGVEPGEAVVIRGNEALSPGQAVEPRAGAG